MDWATILKPLVAGQGGVEGWTIGSFSNHCCSWLMPFLHVGY